MMSNATPSRPATITVDAQIIDRLTQALEKIGAAIPAPRSVTPANEAQARVARDYEVLRGLLGGRARVDGRALRMSRTKNNTITIDDDVPAGAVRAEVDANGVIELIVLTGTKPEVLKLQTIARPDAISRIELLTADGALIAFGPSLPPLP
jgi:hypothetical protein